MTIISLIHWAIVISQSPKVWNGSFVQTNRTKDLFSWKSDSNIQYVSSQMQSQAPSGSRANYRQEESSGITLTLKSNPFQCRFIFTPVYQPDCSSDPWRLLPLYRNVDGENDYLTDHNSPPAPIKIRSLHYARATDLSHCEITGRALVTRETHLLFTRRCRGKA